MSKAYNAAFHRKNGLKGENLQWCWDFENKVESLKILNIIGNSLTEKGRKAKAELQEYVSQHGERYLDLTC